MDFFSKKSLRNFANVRARREFIEQRIGVQLAATAESSFDERQIVGKNIENLIGSTQIPLGIAGPLLIRGEKAKGNYFLPLATTEGALVASISRGCKAISLSGGATAVSSLAGQTRGPVFYVESSKQSKKLTQWITKHQKQLQDIAQQTSKHLRLKHIFIKGLANYVFARFSFDTADAMGMNMVTIATEAMIGVIEQETGVNCLSIAGNFDIDKKPAWLNFINNRGYQVWAEVVIKKEVVEEVLKTTSQRFFDVWLGKCMLGSALSGSLSFNAQYANIIAAIFIATGQDPAHVVEGSMGITTAKVLPNQDLSISVYLPAVIIGTVGGGTNLPTQKEALEILQVSGSSSVEKFAEIVGSAVLAGEVSLIASLSEGSLARAHKQLGRGGK